MFIEFFAAFKRIASEPLLHSRCVTLLCNEQQYEGIKELEALFTGCGEVVLKVPPTALSRLVSPDVKIRLLPN